MVDTVTPEKRSLMMAGIGGKNTKPEMIVRKLLHGAGFRYRLHNRKLPGKPDLVFKKYGAVVFVHGCFWHGHDDCALFRLPKSRTDFWAAKIDSNIYRDESQIASLRDMGWRMAVIWECALKGRRKTSSEALLQELSGFLRSNDAEIVEIRGA